MQAQQGCCLLQTPAQQTTECFHPRLPYCADMTQRHAALVTSSQSAAAMLAWKSVPKYKDSYVGLLVHCCLGVHAYAYRG